MGAYLLLRARTFGPLDVRGLDGGHGAGRHCGTPRGPVTVGPERLNDVGVCSQKLEALLGSPYT